MIRAMFLMFAVGCVLGGLPMAYWADGGVYDVRGLIAVFCAINAAMHLHCARKEGAR